MSSPTDALADVRPGARTGAPARLTRPHPFYWSVRREIWEHRELYVAPLIAAGVILLGVLLSLGHFGHATFDINGHAPDLPTAAPQLIAAMAVFATTSIVAFFYCLGALNNERRDRSILFWKSLPVSDLTVVLSKITIPMVVLPVITFVVIAATQLVVLGVEAVFPTLHAQLPAPPWDPQLSLPWILGMELYLLVATPIWYAPVWAWLLLVSAWSRRGTFLWAILPPLALGVVERLAFGTSYAWTLVSHRLNVAGAASVALAVPARQTHGFVLPRPDPVGFVTNLGVWAGLLFACACLAGAVWLRRRREPI